MKMNTVQNKITVLAAFFSLAKALRLSPSGRIKRGLKRELSATWLGSFTLFPSGTCCPEDLLSPLRCCCPMVDGEPRPWLPSPSPAMDEITFKSDTVLSDVHLHTPNQRHLMVRLSGVGQPVFLSQFKLLWNQASQTDSGAEGGNHRAHHAEVTSPARRSCSSEGASLQAGADATSQEGMAAQLDEDGDLDVVRRPRAASPSKPSGPPRDKVHPMILTQEEDDVLGDEARESGPYDVIKIEHTMATPLEDVGKQVGRSRPLPTALKGLSGAAGHLCSWSLSPPGVAGRPVPGGLHPVPAGPLPGSHGAGARGGHRAGQHPRGHRGADRLLYSVNRQ
ncbi:methyltransferase-like protein 22 isoform X5 [Monodon monoceros]|uniref:methyltransferase-like protein 22 isoform X5 n=1 Tax=Monodon monoceros TaxID=40151 RepID=UPI0010F7219B|nr:methyltransferase-like protein 22 isoform X5 [Monodon monoceros]